MKEQVDQRALDKFTYGLYVVASRNGDRINGLVVNTVVQVALNPTLVSVTINKNSLTNEFIRKSGVLAISVLTQDTPLEFIGRFGFRSGREFDKFAGVNYELGITGAPMLTDYTVAQIEARVRERIDCVTHDLFVAEVVAARVIREAEPLTYSYYHLVKKGKTGKGAPTYREENKAQTKVKKNEGSIKMRRYVCSVCGYVYDPSVGDPENGIPAGTPFENLPAEWVCPVCGATKDQFEPEE
ncbi:MAG: flavin reductase [candidate division WOR-3 bacterium]|uniref:High molecular weight rubredoxin n=1 Tax=candidate division WOR-3 bacterium TaxID=2052148 RepID=A0A7C3ELN2_UNCW3|nr:flavin reductase [candidate division WOR-3 bacterium]